MIRALLFSVLCTAMLQPQIAAVAHWLRVARQELRRRWHERLAHYYRRTGEPWRAASHSMAALCAATAVLGLVSGRAAIATAALAASLAEADARALLNETMKEWGLVVSVEVVSLPRRRR